MLAAVFAPVPHEKRSSDLICIPAAVHFDVTRIVRKLAFVFLTKRKSVTRLRQQTIKKLDVAGMKVVIKLVVARMIDDHHAALFQERLVAIEVEVIPERHYLDQQRVQDRINVRRRDVRNPCDQDVSLTTDRNRVMLETFRDDTLRGRVDLYRVA